MDFIFQEDKNTRQVIARGQSAMSLDKLCEQLQGGLEKSAFANALRTQVFGENKALWPKPRYGLTFYVPLAAGGFAYIQMPSSNKKLQTNPTPILNIYYPEKISNSIVRSVKVDGFKVSYSETETTVEQAYTLATTPQTPRTHRKSITPGNKVVFNIEEYKKKLAEDEKADNASASFQFTNPINSYSPRVQMAIYGLLSFTLLTLTVACVCPTFDFLGEGFKKHNLFDLAGAKTANPNDLQRTLFAFGFATSAAGTALAAGKTKQAWDTQQSTRPLRVVSA